MTGGDALGDDTLGFGVLGPLEVRVGSRRVQLPRLKERTLLGMLLLRANRGVSLDHLAAGLWEDASDSRPPATLRVHVSRLRQTLANLGAPVAPRLMTGGRGYSLEVPDNSLDASLFETGAASGRALLANGEAGAAAETLREALSLWRGPVLEDLSISAVVEPEIVRLEEARLGALEDRVEADLECGRHREVASELEQLVTEAPLRERLWGERMVALYRSDRQAEALRAYEQLRVLLLEELGINPSPALQRLQRAVLEQDASLDLAGSRDSALAPAPATPPDQVWSAAESTGLPGTAAVAELEQPALGLRLPPALNAPALIQLCGRDAQFEHVLQRWKECVGGDRRLVLLSGEAGIGKTRLASEIARRVHDEGGAVLFGRCDEGLGIPFQPFVEALEQIVQLRPDRQLLGRRGGDLVRLVPDVSRRVPGLDPASQAEPDTELYILFDAVAAWLGAMSQKAPVMMVLDDLHWAERSTLLLLRHIARSIEPMRVLIVATYRDTDLGTGHPLADVVAELRREPACERVELAGLDLAAVGELLENTGHGAEEQSRQFAEWICTQTSGNPFFLQEIMRGIGEFDGAAERGGVLTSEAVAALGVPQGVREMIALRLRKLGPAANQVLSLASAMGAVIDFDILVAASSRNEDVVLDALDEATTSLILRETSSGDYEFTHALVRSTLYEDLGSARRRSSHRHIAEALIARPNPDVAAIAFHLGRAGDQDERVVDYASSGGDLALDHLAFDQAVTLFTQALGAAEAAGAGARRVCELNIRLGTAQRLAALPAYRETLLRAAAAAEQLGEGELLARAALANNRGLESVAGAIDEERVRYLEAALDKVGSADSATRSRLLAVLALELMWTPRDERRLMAADESVAVARRLDDPGTLLQVLIAAHVACSVPDRVPALAAEFPSLLDLAEGSGDVQQLAFACGIGSSHFTELGDVVEADRLIALIDLHAKELDTPFWHWMVAVHRACRVSVSGTGDELEAAALDAMQLGQVAAQPDLFTWFGPVLFFARWAQGRLPEIVGLASQAADDLPALAGWRAAAALCLAATGDRDQASAIVDDLMAEGEGCFSNNIAWLLSHSILAEAIITTGTIEQAAAEYAVLEPYAGRIPCIVVVTRPGVNLWLASLAARAGWPDRAEQHFAAAHEQHLRLAAPVWVARTRLDWGRFLLEQGEVGRGRALLAQALDSATRLGSVDIAEQSRQLLTSSD
jgi:DNA-binding SARP family transcriptional activator